VSVREEVMVELKEMIAEKAEEQQAIAKAQRDRREGEIRRLNQQLQQLIQMRAKELLTDEEFREQKALLIERKAAQEASLGDFDLDLTRLRDNIRQITFPLMNLADTWTRLDPALRQRFKRMLLPVGFLARQIRTAELGRLFYVCAHLADPNSTEGSLTGETLNQVIEEIRAFAGLFRGNDTNNLAVQQAVQTNSRD
jgi:hypothetical protein